jgi:hypothetical protein
MAKRVILTLMEGNFEQGFPVILWIKEDGATAETVIQGRLPPAPDILELFNNWQLAYRQLVMPHSRIKPKPAQVTNFSSRELGSELEHRLNDWLNLGSRDWQKIRDGLQRNLCETEEIQVIIQTENVQLRRLPLHLWDLFDNHYTKAEIALSAPEYKPQDSTTPVSNKVRILAILGDSTGIDVQKDKAILDQLPNAETTFLVEPQRQELTNLLWEKQWEILFFAGHSFSQVDGNTGKIYINKTDSLSIAELKNALRTAIERGLQLAIFNSCDGLGLARELADLHIPQIIVMREPVPDQVAQEFLKHFLSSFSQGKSLYLAVREARGKLEGLENQFPFASWLPVICQNPAAVPLTWQRLFHRNVSSKPIIQRLFKGFFLLLIGLISSWLLTTVRNMVINRPLVNSTICSINFSGEVGPQVGVNLYLNPRLAAGTSELVPHNTTLNFDGWAYGETVNDIWTGDPDALWYKLSNRNRWVPSAKIKGYPPGNVPFQPNNKSSLSNCFKIPQIPANHWKAEYFRSHQDLEGNSVFPVFVEDLGDGSQGFSPDWRSGAPSNTPSDNFSARITTNRYFSPGNHLIKVKADDGIRVWVNEQLLIDKVEQAFINFQCNYFHSKGGKYPVKVEYKEDGGLAYLSVYIQPKESASVSDCNFEESVSGFEWNSSFFRWDQNLSQPPVDFYNVDKIAVLNLGSNRRSDGRYGIQQSWGTRSPKEDFGIPADFFIVRSYTHADFQKGKTYRARIRTPKGFQLLAKHHSLPDNDPNKWVHFTPKDEWQYTDGAYKDIKFAVPNDGKYDFHFHLYKGSGNAYIDLLWEDVTPSEFNS